AMGAVIRATRGRPWTELDSPYHHCCAVVPAELTGCSSIPYLTSVAAGFYRNDFIYGSETSAGRARSMMSEFAVAPAYAMGAVIGPPGEAMEELDSPYHHCCAVVPAELTGCSLSYLLLRSRDRVPKIPKHLSWRSPPDFAGCLSLPLSCGEIQSSDEDGV
ncbi:hypothetical protein THAOC_10955, partial [Thalassiosira oceanica]